MTTNTEDAIAVVVVDDSKEFLTAACAWLEGQQALRLVGSATDGLEALETVARVGPDLVLIDAFMPVMGGLAATRAIKSRSGAPQVILLSVHDGGDMEREARSAGADAFVSKSQFSERLPGVIRDLFAAPRPAKLMGTEDW